MTCPAAHPAAHPAAPDPAVTLARALETLAAFADPGRALSAFAGLVAVGGGTMVLPEPGNNWAPGGPDGAVLSLHGVTGLGETATEALADWRRAARRQVENSDCVAAAEARVLTATGGAEALRRDCDMVALFSRNPRARLAVAALADASRMGLLA